MSLVVKATLEINVSSPVWIYRHTPDYPGHDLYAVDISEDGEIIASGPHPYTGIHLLSKDGTLVQEIPPQALCPQSIDLTSDGQFGVFGDRYTGTVWFFSKDSPIPVWNYTVGGNVQTVAISMAATLSAYISPKTAKIKIGESVTFTSTVFGGQSPYNYQWYLNGSTVSGATYSEWTFEPTTTGFYIVYLNVTDNLGNTVKSNEATATVKPKLAVSISPMTASILIGQSVDFTSTVSGGYTPYSYQWYINGNPVSGANSPSWSFTPTSEGIYYVHLEVTDANNNVAQSDNARITASTVPVGGYSVPIQLPTIAKPAISYITLLTILTAIFIKGDFAGDISTGR